MSFKRSSGCRVINLDGADGNAFVLMGLAQNFAKQLNWNSADILAEMRAGNYTNLVCVFDKYFGDMVTLETDQDILLEALEDAQQARQAEFESLFSKG
jgi:hypothetical protein